MLANGSVNIGFGNKTSAPPSDSADYKKRDNEEKIRFRPKRNYLTQMLMHTQVGIVENT